MKFLQKLSHKNAIKTENRVKIHRKSGHIVAIFVEKIGHIGHGFQKIWPYLIFKSWEHCMRLTVTATFGRNKRRFPLLKVCPRFVFQFISNWFTCISQRYGFCYSTKYFGFCRYFSKIPYIFPHIYYSYICLRRISILVSK